MTEGERCLRFDNINAGFSVFTVEGNDRKLYSAAPVKGDGENRLIVDQQRDSIVGREPVGENVIFYSPLVDAP